MKRIIYIISLLSAVIFWSCDDKIRTAGFEDAEQYTIYDYVVEKKDTCSDFLQILQAGGLDKTLSAYNPNGTDYTLFLPSNDAIDKFIQSTEGISSINDIINNKEYASAFARYHVVNMGVLSQDFPFGAFSEPTLSDDYLTVSFVVGTDSSYYKINNQAAVIKRDIEVSNGIIHEIEVALKPITYTSYNWLQDNSGYSILKEAMEVTGVKSLIDFNSKEEDSPAPVTLLVEPDDVFKANGINSLDDLKQFISPGKTDYTNPTNPLYGFCAYHILTGSRYINDFEGQATNYTTFSEVPISINGLGNDIYINKGKQVFDTIISGIDTTIIDYITFLYDESNITSQSGAIHLIDRIMTQKTPSRAQQDFQFYEEPFLNAYRGKAGSYLIEDPTSLYNITWDGPDLFFVDEGDQYRGAWDNDYLEIDGDFTITYQVPKIVQGKYTVYLTAEAFNSANALVEVYIDGKKVSGLVDLSQGGNANNPFQRIELGTIDFKKYESHIVEVKPLIPGRFLWDRITFEPI